MGEAKRKREALRATLIKSCDEWLFPPSKQEAEIASEISQLPVEMVERASDWQLRRIGMEPRKCHSNARFMAENDPTKQTKQVFGWLVQGGGNFVLHSVIKQRDHLFCVTPSPFNPENPFPFVPDAAIEVREEDGGVFYRKGLRIEAVVRSNPEVTIRRCLENRKRLEAWGNPYDAMRVWI